VGKKFRLRLTITSLGLLCVLFSFDMFNLVLVFIGQGKGSTVRNRIGPDALPSLQVVRSLVIFPAIEQHCPLASIKLYCFVMGTL